MRRRRNRVAELLVCCIALWVVVSSSSGETTPSPHGCDSMLALSSGVASFSHQHTSIHTRSLSPWRWRSSTVKDRVPSTLWEAECIDVFCSVSGPHRHSFMSVPVYQSVLVLVRQQEARCYTASYTPVAVGCTCVRTKTSQN